MPTLLQKPFVRHYKAPLISRATLLLLILLMLTLILPFLFAYASQGFWLKESSFREQPNIQYKNSMILILQGQDISTNKNIYLFWSTDAIYNNLMSEYLRIPSIKTAEIDTDYDGKFDYMTLIASIPLKPTERIYSVRSALIFDYQLSSRLRLQMESAIITDTTTPIPSSSLIIHGDMKFIQRKLLPYKSTLNRINGGINIKEPVFNSTRVLFSGDDSVVEKDGMVFKSKFLGYGLSSGVGGELESVRRKVGLWESLVGDYYNRNERTELLYSTPIWTYDQTPKTFQLSYKIRFPQDKFLYIPGLAEVLKYGWIQYFSYVVIVGVAAKALFEFAVMNFLVPSFVTVDRIPLPVTTGAYGSKYPDRGVYGFKAHSF